MKKSNKRLDFLPNRQNKYSIRKFTVGTASILVGAILLFGAQNDAQAEEAPADKASTSTDEKKLEVSPVEKSTAEVAAEVEEVTTDEEASEAPTTEQTVTEVETPESTVTKEEVVEAEVAPKNTTEASESPEPTSKATSSEDTTNEVPSVEEETSNEVVQEAPTSEAIPAAPTTSDASTSSTEVTHASEPDITSVNDQTTAVDYVTSTTPLSASEAETLVSDLNLDYNNTTPEALQAALLDGLVAAQNAAKTEATTLDRRQTSALSDIGSVTYGKTAFRAVVTPQDGLADNATYQPYANQAATNYRFGEVGDASLAISNKDELPANTQYAFKNNNAFQQVGHQLATVVATYPDGTVDEVQAPIYVSYGYDKNGQTYTGVPYSAENNFPRTEEDVHITPILEDLSSSEAQADHSIDFDLSSVFNLNRVTSGMETYIELDERIAKYVTSITGNIASTAGGAAPQRPFEWERVVNAKGELTNTWKMRTFNALAYTDNQTSVFIGDQPAISQLSKSKINLDVPVSQIFADDPLLQNGDLAFRTYTLTNKGQLINNTDRSNYFQVARDDKDGLTNATNLQERNWFTGSGSITQFEPEAGTNGGIVFDQYINKSSNGTLNGYGGQPNRDWKYHFEIDPRLLPYIKDVEIHYLNQNGTDWSVSTELQDRFNKESNLNKTGGWNNFEYRFNNGTNIESAYTTGTTWNDTRTGSADKASYSVPDVELTPGQGYINLDAIAINVDARQVNFNPGLIQPAKVRVVAVLRDDVTINKILGENRDENFGFTGYFVNSKNEVIPNSYGTGFYQAVDIDLDGIVDEIDPTIEEKPQPVQTADNYTPVGQPVETPVGVTPDPRDGISNIADLPADAVYSWEVVPNVDAPTADGDPIKAAVIITYNDGSQDRVEVPVTVTDTPDVTAPDAPVIDAPIEGDRTVRGTAEPNSTVAVTFPNGETVEAPVDGAGNWSVEVPTTEELAPGETITATATDAAGNVSEPGTTTVIEDPNKDVTAPDAPVIDAPIEGDRTVRGTAEPNSTVAVTFPNGETVEAPVDGAGNWSVEVPTTEELAPGETITATATDAAGNVSEPGTTTVIEDPNKDVTAPDAPVIDAPIEGDRTVRGTAEPNSTVAVTFPNGETVEAPVDGAGNWSVEVPTTEELAPGETITATATDAAGNVSEPGTTTVIEDPNKDVTAPDAPVIDAPIEGDRTVRGTAEPNSTVAVTFPNGETVEAPVDGAGNWSVEVPTTEELAPGETITATATDAAGNVSEPGTTTVIEDPNKDVTAPDAPVVNAVQPGDKTITGTGEPGSTVTVMFPNGETATGTVDENGNWSVEVPTTEELAPGETITATATDAAGNVSEPGTTTVIEDPNKDVTAPDAPVIDAPIEGDRTVRGTAEPNSTVAVTFPNGETVEAPVDGAGNWSVEVPTTEELAPGETITATATDAAGNVSEPGTTTVIEDPNKDVTAPDAPVVNAVQPGDKTITGTGEPGSTVTVMFPNGETATGTVDENGNWSVEVPEGTELKQDDVITAVVTDSNGNVSEPGNVTVNDTIAPDAPVVNAVQPGDKTITGTGEPGSTVTVTFPNGETATGTVDENGNWSVEVPEGTELKQDDVITAVVTDGNGNVSEAGNVTVNDTIAPDAPVVNAVQPGDKTITGTGEPGSTVTVMFPNGETATGTVDENGNWSVEVPEGTELKQDDVITAVVTDGNGNVSEAGNVTVNDTIAPDAPVVNAVQPGDKTITGTGEPGSTVTVTFPNGETATGTVDENGNWSVEVPEGTELKQDDVITAVVTDSNGNASEPSSVKVNDTIAPEAPVVNAVQPGDKTITGTGEPGSTVTVTFPNGETATGTVDENGNWSVEVPEGTELKQDDVITAVVTDGNGNVSEAGNVTVNDTIAPDAPVVNAVQPGDKTITGTGEPGSTVTVTFPNGETATGTVDENGNWSVEVPEGTELKQDDVITAVVTDSNGNVSEPGNVTVNDTIAPDAPVVNAVQPGDKTITGTGEPGSTVTVTFPNGETATGTVDENGNWSVEVPEGTELKQDDVITAVVTDGNGNVSEAGNVTVNDTIAPDAPVVNAVQPGDKTITGTGEPGSTVTVTFPNGETATGTVDENGNWSVEVPEGTELKQDDVITAVVTDSNGNASEPSSVKVNDTIAPEAPVVNAVQPGDKTITGTGEPGSTVTVTFPNGETATGTVDENGNWSVEVPEGTELKQDDVITAVVTDSNGNASEPSSVKVNDTIAPEAPVVNAVQPGDKTITGTGEPGSTVTVTFPNGETATGTVDENGNWSVEVPEGTELKQDDVITAVVTDSNGNASEPSSVKVNDTIAPDAPVVNAPQPGDKVITGTGEPGSTVTVTFPNGETATGTVDENGNWSVEVPEGTELKQGDVITAVLTDSNGNISKPGSSVVVAKASSEKPGITSTKPEDKTITGAGKPDSTVTVAPSNGKSVDASVDKDGDAHKVASSKEAKALPETGTTSTNPTLFGGLIAAFGSLFLLGRRRKEKEDK
ncbi:Ig-like domain-containing protein [Staphylococcus ratti]|uniref:Ig-like domain-containing protein n=1 Tax=Staphylococcus ratti TaxID=2892440 RepID=A0ABY3PDL2_9STAP|nr:Ig-like domain-containing protein [Staphylococcus ratti]UEX90408.1 Ig-like domain-containing protein [Staphylococcus ratti]